MLNWPLPPCQPCRDFIKPASNCDARSMGENRIIWMFPLTRIISPRSLWFLATDLIAPFLAVFGDFNWDQSEKEKGEMGVNWILLARSLSPSNPLSTPWQHFLRNECLYTLLTPKFKSLGCSVSLQSDQLKFAFYVTPITSQYPRNPKK